MKTASYDIKMSGFPFETKNPQLKAKTILAIQETEQIIEEYNNGIRKQKAFANAHEMFMAMDAEVFWRMLMYRCFGF